MENQLQHLIDGLNIDLTYEYGAIIQYTYSASVVSGLYRSSLKPFFEAEITDELGHALYLSEKIKSLGGKPTNNGCSRHSSANRCKGFTRSNLEIRNRYNLNVMKKDKNKLRTLD